MSTKKSSLTHDSSAEPLMYEDVSLTRKYSVMEIAMLAAGCRGETRAERISDAVELLAMVERYARGGKETRLSIRDREKARKSPTAKNGAAAYSEIQQRLLQKALGIREVATRDKKSGKIGLTSLVGLAYEAATGGKADSSEAMRRFNEWVTEEAGEEAVTAKAFKARFTSGSKLVVIRNDHEALVLGMQLIGYLGKSPKRQPTKIIQSKNPETKGQILSPKTRGSDIADGTEHGLSKAGKRKKPKQFKKKQAAVVVVHEDSRRGNKTRMNGNGSD